MADRAMRAVAWSFASSALGKLATIVIGVMLARMLSPRDFGTYAVAYAALRILVSLNDLGLSLAIVRWPGDPREVTPTVSTIAVFTSVVMYAACYLGAPAYATAMGAPAAAGVVRVLCIGVLLDGFVSSPMGLLQRQFRQDLRLITDQVNLWLGTIVSVVLAWRGFGPMSLGIGRVAGCVASLILLIWFSPEPVRFGFKLARARDVARFGLPVAASTIIAFGVMNADQVVVGRLLGVTALGYFVLAANLSNWPVTVFAQPVRNVALAAFARLQHDPPAMRRAFLLVASMLTAVALPVCLMMSGAAAPLVGFAYGHRWQAAAPILAWLGILAALQIAFELAYDFFVVLAQARVIFILQLVWLLVLVPVLAAGARAGGVDGVVQAEIGVAAGLVLPWYLWELRRAGIRGRVLARRLRVPAAGAGVAGLGCWGAGLLIPSELPALLLSGAAGALIIAVLVRRLRPGLTALRRRSAQPSGSVPLEPVPDGSAPAGEVAPGEWAPGEWAEEEALAGRPPRGRKRAGRVPAVTLPAQARSGSGRGGSGRGGSARGAVARGRSAASALPARAVAVVRATVAGETVAGETVPAARPAGQAGSGQPGLAVPGRLGSPWPSRNGDAGDGAATGQSGARQGAAGNGAAGPAAGDGAAGYGAAGYGAAGPAAGNGADGSDAAGYGAAGYGAAGYGAAGPAAGYGAAGYGAAGPAAGNGADGNGAAGNGAAGDGAAGDGADGYGAAGNGAGSGAAGSGASWWQPGCRDGVEVPVPPQPGDPQPPLFRATAAALGWEPVPDSVPPEPRLAAPPEPDDQREA